MAFAVEREALVVRAAAIKKHQKSIRPPWNFIMKIRQQQIDSIDESDKQGPANGPQPPYVMPPVFDKLQVSHCLLNR